MESTIVDIYTDGACRNNPGPGGWGAILKWKGHEKSISGGEPMTTNNRMEMLAAIRALETHKRPCKVRITTDSQYLMNGITRWLKNWKKRGWKTSQNTPVKNADLWQQLDAIASRHQVEWKWIRGHRGHEDNERADSLARTALKQFAKS